MNDSFKATHVQLFEKAKLSLPQQLSDWDLKIESWCQEYINNNHEAEISEIIIDFAVFLFDHKKERVVVAYALSVEQLLARDSTRMRGFPDVNASMANQKKENKFVADKGHFLGHASGGILDINLFPQRRELNRGWSEQGKQFRKMERCVANNLWTFFYHRPIYDDNTWIPNKLEYGILVENLKWWIEKFDNK